MADHWLLPRSTSRFVDTEPVFQSRLVPVSLVFIRHEAPILGAGPLGQFGESSCRYVAFFVLCSRTLHQVESMMECHVGIALAFTPKRARTRLRLESTASNLCKGRGKIGDSRPAIVSIVSTETGLPTLPPSAHSGS